MTFLGSVLLLAIAAEATHSEATEQQIEASPRTLPKDDAIDLSRIDEIQEPPPDAAPPPPATLKDPTSAPDAAETKTNPKGGRGTYFVQSTLAVDRSVPPPALGSPSDIRVRNVSFVDGQLARSLTSRMNIQASARINLSVGDYGTSTIARPLRLDLRETFATWSVSNTAFLDLGRINQKFGVGYSYNPTDVFRAGTQVDPLTADPRALREGRLGSLMVRGQTFWADGQIQAIWSPGVAHSSPLLTNQRRKGLDLQLDRTNSRDRFVIRLEQNLGDRFRPELLLFDDGEAVAVGLSATVGVGSATILHAEAAFANRPSVLGSAINRSRETRDIFTIAQAMDKRDARQQRVDAVIGATVTLSSWTITGEYHYDGAGLRGKRWDALLAAAASSPVERLRLQYLKIFGVEAGRATTRNSFFLRASRPDVFVRDLELSSFVLIAPDEETIFFQTNAEYALNDSFSLNGTINVLTGTDSSTAKRLGRSERFLIGLRYYF